MSNNLINRIDGLGWRKNRPEFIERAVWDYFERQIRRTQDLKDTGIINNKARKLNQEAEDVLTFQAEL